ncbi:MAG: hypothetical protein QHJ73_00740 [Armatimonadota bacterium]|nr:hypothetical protein [Armatimonadota bacterium]
MRRFAFLFGGLSLAIGANLGANAAPTPKSGLQVGEAMPAFQVVDVTGPNKDKPSLCYI